jgi:hypothetical protein
MRISHDSADVLLKEPQEKRFVAHFGRLLARKHALDKPTRNQR